MPTEQSFVNGVCFQVARVVPPEVNSTLYQPGSIEGLGIYHEPEPLVRFKRHDASGTLLGPYV